jgi:predicted secreted Zn-dependent protease
MQNYVSRFWRRKLTLRTMFALSLLAALFVLVTGLLLASDTISAPLTFTRPNRPLAAQPAAVSTPTVSGATTTSEAIASNAVCDGTPYALPAQMAADSLAEGLTSVIEPPSYYLVHGSDLPAIRAAIEACPLRKQMGEYHAITTYAIVWSYDLTKNGAVCSLRNVRVGLRVNQYLPSFVPSTANDLATTEAWQTYIASLQAHENGHTALDTQYAGRLVSSLLATSGACETIDSQAKTVAESVIAILDAANELYDTRTNHGATQGAVL